MPSDGFDAVMKTVKAVILAEPIPTPQSEHIKAVCAEQKIPCLVLTPDNADLPPCDLRSFCRDAGCHVVCDRDAVIYRAGNRLFVHAVTDGDHTLNIGGRLRNLPDGTICGSTIPMHSGESRLFTVE